MNLAGDAKDNLWHTPADCRSWSMITSLCFSHDLSLKHIHIVKLKLPKQKINLTIIMCVQSFTAEDGVSSSPQCHFYFREQSRSCGKNQTFSLLHFPHRYKFQMFKFQNVCIFRAMTVAPCCSAAMTVERWHLCQSSTSPSRASRGTSPPWSASGTWTSEPPPRTATLPWTHCTRTASRESPECCCSVN